MSCYRTHKLVFGFFTLFVLWSCGEDDSFELKGNEPNFLIILTDDHRYDVLGVVQKEQGSAGRYPWLKTPYLDRLATEGTRFRNAFTVTSLCSPSRASILTGQYTRQHGIRDNSTSFNSATFIEDLQNHGYYTAHFGKQFIAKQAEVSGFEYTFSFPGESDYFDQKFERNGTPVNTKGWVDHTSTEALLEHFKVIPKKPFCLVIGYKTAHGPWNESPEGFGHLYEHEKIRKVPNLDIPAVYTNTSEHIASDEYYDKFEKSDITALKCITAVDYNVGRIIHRLDSLGLSQNTVVIFLSDNGFYHGEHGLRDKRSAYEESIRIPMIIKGPGIPSGKVYDELVLNIDVAPTIYDLSGIPGSFKTQGLSLTKLFDGLNWREAFLYEYFKESIGPPFDIMAVRTENLKLIKYENHDQWTELFDLQKDPYETRNLINDPDYSDFLSELNTMAKKLAWRLR